ncbi:hypothetical protein ACH4TX_12230 [Streptomyces sp. NPDC021098]|uniref:hypothetical protein n=1 Tax=unclassified Streptomyces TaxID=2593676 RepID=UPI00378DA939
MNDTTGIEETVRRMVSAAVEREVTEGPAGAVTVALRRGARSVELREAGSGWLVAWQGCGTHIDCGDGTLVPSLEEALELAVRLLDAEREGPDKEEERRKARKPVAENDHATTNGVRLRNAALSSSTTASPHPPSASPAAAPHPRPHLPTGPERGRGGRSL